MNFKNKLRFTSSSIGVASLNAMSDIRSAFTYVASFGLRARIAVVGGSALLYGVGAASVASAAGCAVGGTDAITKVLSNATALILTVGGIGAILMGVFGAVLIMFSGGNSERAKKGMTIVKNVVIALAIMGGIYLIRYVIVTFTQGSANAVSANSGDCAAGILTQSGNLTVTTG